MFQSWEGDTRILPHAAVGQSPQRMEQHPTALLHKDRQTARRSGECGVWWVRGREILGRVGMG